MQALSPTNPFMPSSLEPSLRPIPSGPSTGVAVDSVGLAKPVDTLTQQAVPAATAQSESEKVKESVQKVNEMVKTMGHNLEFSVDDETQVRVVKVMDTQTNEVIRQIPSEDVLQIAKVLDRLQGLLIKDKV